MSKLGWWAGAPWDVRAYAAGHPSYPTDSTLEQLYDSAEFDAYRELGMASVQLAIQHGHLSVALSRPEPPGREGLSGRLAGVGLEREQGTSALLPEGADQHRLDELQ